LLKPVKKPRRFLTEAKKLTVKRRLRIFMSNQVKGRTYLLKAILVKTRQKAKKIFDGSKEVDRKT